LTQEECNVSEAFEAAPVEMMRKVLLVAVDFRIKGVKVWMEWKLP